MPIFFGKLTKSFGFGGIEEHQRLLEGVEVVDDAVNLKKYRYTGA